MHESRCRTVTDIGAQPKQQSMTTHRTHYTIEREWPAKELSPNARVHWAIRAKAVRMARESACSAMREALGWRRLACTQTERLQIECTFHPPIDARRRDLDNCIASIKSTLDGISDATGINDHQFRLSCEMGGEVARGRVVIVVGVVTQ